ncbi:hypothetical protein ACC699_39150, partial [Rhizobium ruizarguesonis]
AARCAEGERRAALIEAERRRQQEQWQLSFFLRYAHHKLKLQAAIDQPLFHTSHFPGSFYPRTRETGSLMAEANFGPDVLDALRR